MHVPRATGPGRGAENPVTPTALLPAATVARANTGPMSAWVVGGATAAVLGVGFLGWALARAAALGDQQTERALADHLRSTPEPEEHPDT